MSVSILLVVLVAVSLVWIWGTLRPRAARRFYRRIETARKVGGAVILVIFAVTFIQSGRWYLILLAIVAIALAALYVVVERPDRRVT